MTDQELPVVLLAGASGFVGGYLLEALLDAPDFGRVFAVTRRPLGREHPRLANRIVQFERLEAQLAGMRCHVAFCCLGASANEAGSESALRRVDVESVLAFARAARAAQAQRFVVVSCAGASAQSKRPSLRIKAEMEQGLEALQFPALDILQPGPLLGFRRELHPAAIAATLFMPVLNPFLVGTHLPSRGIPARTVAAAALGAARSGRRGVYRYTYAGLLALASSKPIRAIPSSKPRVQSGA